MRDDYRFISKKDPLHTEINLEQSNVREADLIKFGYKDAEGQVT